MGKLSETMQDWMLLLRQNKVALLGLFIVTVYIFMAILAPLIATHDPKVMGERKEIFNAPSSEHWLGTDEVGRDIFSGLVYGSRVSLIVGFIAALISAVCGTLVGLISGYYGGTLGDLLMRITDVFLVIPPLPLMMVLVALMGPNLTNIILVIAILSWPSLARVIRAELLSLRERQFVERCRSLGASNSRILFRHLLPNLIPLILANIVLIISSAIFYETTMSFLGLGDPTIISWGSMLRYSFVSLAAIKGIWWYVLPPALSIILLIVGFTLAGFVLEEALNPRLRGV